MPLNEEQRKRIEERGNADGFIRHPLIPIRHCGEPWYEAAVCQVMNARSGYTQGVIEERIKNHELHEESLRLLKDFRSTGFAPPTIDEHITTLSSLVGEAKNEQG